MKWLYNKNETVVTIAAIALVVDDEENDDDDDGNRMLSPYVSQLKKRVL